jgi:hypothetical protein
MEKHTPKPWTLDVKKRRVSAGESPIADVFMWPHPKQQQANACLIAAAPELLEALTDLIAEIDEDQSSASLSVRIGKARAAIAKATT